MIDVQCACGTRLRLEDQWAGKQGRCPRCGQVIEIPVPRPTVHETATVSATVLDQAIVGGAEPAMAARAPVVEPEFAPPPVVTPVGAPSVARPAPVVSRGKSKRAPLPVSPPPVAENSNPPTPVPSASDTSAIDTLAPLRNLIGNRLAIPFTWPPSNAVLMRGAIAAVAVLVLLIGLVAGRRWLSGSNETVAVNNPDQAPETAPATPPNTPPPAVPKPQGVTNPAPTQQPSPRPTPTTTNPPATTDPVAPPIPANANNATIESQPPAPVTPRPRRPGNGFSGVSREYDDLSCRRIQSESGVRVPAAATIIEVNGERLPFTNVAALQSGTAPYLFLPRGEHAVRWRPGEQPVSVTIAKDHAETYAAMREFFSVGGAIRQDELFSRGARALDVHGAPYLLNWLGASYAANQEWPAAERKFRRALRVNPLFAPAHLNLAHARLQRGDRDEAARETLLADAFNVGNAFGLAEGVAELRRKLGLGSAPPNVSEPLALSGDRYVSTESLSEEDARLRSLMVALSKYAVQEEERAKILNNLGAHFADLRKTELALEHFRLSLEALKSAGPDRFALARQVFSHMTKACERAGFPEAGEYAKMQESVLP